MASTSRVWVSFSFVLGGGAVGADGTAEGDVKGVMDRPTNYGPESGAEIEKW